MSEMITNEQAIAMIAELTKQLEELKGGSKVTNDGMKKNQRPGKANAGRKYILLSKELKSWGKVPQQQADIAKLLSKNMEVGKEYAESEVFDMLMEKSAEYNSLLGSKQDPTYLFRYYRGLKNDQKHAGFIARGFLQMK